MSERKVRAWAVVDKTGDLLRTMPKFGGRMPYAIYGPTGLDPIEFDSDEGERVVPVEIVYKDPGK